MGSFSRRFIVLLAVQSLAVLIIQITSVQQVFGDSPAEEPRVVHPDRPIPANGGILIEGLSHPSSIDEIEVRDQTGRLIAGELITVNDNGLLAWRPLDSLFVGLVLEITIATAETNYGSVSSASIAVEFPWTPAVPLFTTETNVDISEWFNDACCGPSAAATEPHCFDVARVVRASAIADFFTNAPPSHLNQYVYNIDDKPYWQTQLSRIGVEVDETDEEVCFSIRLRHILTLEDTDLSPVCVQVGDLPELGVTPLEHTEHLSIDRCGQPPIPDINLWCDINRTRCQDLTSPECSNYEEVCLKPPPVTVEGSDSSVESVDAAIVDATYDAPGDLGRVVEASIPNVVEHNAEDSAGEVARDGDPIPTSGFQEIRDVESSAISPEETVERRSQADCGCSAIGSRNSERSALWIGLVSLVVAMVMRRRFRAGHFSAI